MDPLPYNNYDWNPIKFAFWTSKREYGYSQCRMRWSLLVIKCCLANNVLQVLCCLVRIRWPHAVSRQNFWTVQLIDLDDWSWMIRLWSEISARDQWEIRSLGRETANITKLRGQRNDSANSQKPLRFSIKSANRVTLETALWQSHKQVNHSSLITLWSIIVRFTANNFSLNNLRQPIVSKLWMVWYRPMMLSLCSSGG